MLNTLTSPGMVAASLALLTGGGRFVEISKRDVVGSARVKQDRPDVDAMMLAVDFLPPHQIQVRRRAVYIHVCIAILHVSIKLSSYICL